MDQGRRPAAHRGNLTPAESRLCRLGITGDEISQRCSQHSELLQLSSFALLGLLLVFQTLSSRNSSSIRAMLLSGQHRPGAVQALGAQLGVGDKGGSIKSELMADTKASELDISKFRYEEEVLCGEDGEAQAAQRSCGCSISGGV